jgi:hypothetical protein
MASRKRARRLEWKCDDILSRNISFNILSRYGHISSFGSFLGISSGGKRGGQLADEVVDSYSQELDAQTCPRIVLF